MILSAEVSSRQGRLPLLPPFSLQTITTHSKQSVLLFPHSLRLDPMRASLLSRLLQMAPIPVKKFDIIVIGGGSGSSVFVSRFLFQFGESFIFLSLGGFFEQLLVESL